jgi:hypothetical protein
LICLRFGQFRRTVRLIRLEVSDGGTKEKHG